MFTSTNEVLKDKVVLVTGGAQGLGRAICELLLMHQARVIMADIQKDKGNQAVEELKEMAGSIEFYKLDLRRYEEVTNLFKEIKQKYSRIDAVVNNAGIDFTKPISELSVEEWDAAMAVNLRGPFLMAKSALEMMVPQKEGYIINIISTAALRAWPEASVYHASKWGLRGFTHALFTEARKSDIKVTALIAGGMKTPFLLDRFPDIDQSLLQDPKAVAKEVVHLLSMSGRSAPAGSGVENMADVERVADKGTIIPELMVIPLNESSWP